MEEKMIEEEQPKATKSKDKKEKESVASSSVKTIVVEQLPMQPYNKGVDETTGQEFAFMTRDEVLAEILEAVRYIKKGI